ncbi:ABC transporter ATP-binding protein [Sphaerisporangium siamense]|uniref:Branched-chain amino acid transport system ATP-binding protein n=1 Tax=Sphaerisporangium siamense TaxID=795645 RepID=A0A7W7DEI8_9ACTN|nr:ATP-binding cassette domain-containing protein [Sphaerisporangium siamense]MBB4704555.1 branched-chain amino acid transport system ATP-binding protein [Sphaerisporangium siamense]GII86167.1 ABC transporter ATP-binding protein [Sphaerisporangium siamense]
MKLEISDLTVRFGGVKPLDGVTLTFESGLCGLIGPNGAGKTTLFNVLSGFVRPSSGAAHVNGTDLLALPAHRRARWGLRRTFQQEQLVAELSVGANLLLARDHLAAGTAGANAAELLEFVGLAGPDRPVGGLTLFERRKLELARSLAGTPKIVLLDEPSAGLSEAESMELAGAMRAVPERFGALVVLIEHDMGLVGEICGTTAVLDFGRLVTSGPTAEVLNDDRVRAAYLGEPVA